MFKTLTYAGWSQVPYYVEMFVEICCLTVDLAHHVHMLLRANMLLSMASLVIFMQLRVLYAQLMGRLKRHRNFRRIAFLISSSCPIVLVECEPNSSYEDCKCAICWEGMAQARKLACGHNFHHGNFFSRIFHEFYTWSLGFSFSRKVACCIGSSKILRARRAASNCPTVSKGAPDPMLKGPAGPTGLGPAGVVYFSNRRLHLTQL